ncbi:hypothetical protein MtrunA17_Chr6g0472821 [Medicago truncatula]|uniref:Uncharacterized protein n=1 Tax=Medicago truncatula TaxID=3880 RepID=A0A396HGS1_MEDTR|nr:hypothetical protein MtrunA17_Chr6g0472821 [Medicago truncatula]
MYLIPRDVYTELNTDLKESNALSNLMDDFPPICKQDPLEVQMNFIKEHFALTCTKIRLEDVLETMYGGALPVAKSRKTKRKALTEDEYLDDAPEQPRKKAKKAKKEKSSSKVNEVGLAVPTIQEEVQDLDADKVLNKRTRSGKVVSISHIQPPQPSIPKKKRKTANRKLKLAEYVSEDEEHIVAATDLVIRELEKKKAEDVAALTKIRELAKGIEVPISSIAREDVGTTEEVQEDDDASSGAAAPEADKGNSDSPHHSNVIVVESSSTTSSQSTSLTSSSDMDDVPLNKIYENLHKALSPSPSTKLHKEPAHEEFVHVYPQILKSIGEMSEMRNKSLLKTTCKPSFSTT